MIRRHIFINTIFALILTNTSFADCLWFDFLGNIKSLPTIVHARVNSSKVPSCKDYGSKNCKYSFSVEIIEVLKGEVSAKTLDFSYRYWIGCPGVDTFTNGKEYIFAVKEVNSRGISTLNGVSCGSWGTAATELKRVKEVLSEMDD